MREWMRGQEVVKQAKYAHRGYQKIEEKWRAASARAGVKFECLGAGCNECCKQWVIGSLVTGILIADRLLETGDLKRLKRVIDQGERMNEALAGRGPVGCSTAWCEQHELCALVREDGACSVYDVRPPACSSYFVQGGPKVCATALSETQVASANNFDLMELAFGLDNALLKTLFGPEFDGVAIMGSLGSQVNAGLKLLESPDRFLQFVEQYTQEFSLEG